MIKKLSLSTYQFLGSLGLILVCLASIIQLQQNRIRYPVDNFTKEDYLAQEAAEKLQLEIINKFPSFGFKNVIADWLYLRYIQYFGDYDPRLLIGYNLSPLYMQALVERDPLFVDALIKLDTGTSIFGGYPQVSVDSLEKSLSVMPTHLKGNYFAPYYLWITKGINELLFLGDTKAAQKSYEMAAQWADTYDTPDAKRTAQRVRQTAQFLEKRPSSKVAQIGAWTMVISSTSDERTIKRAIQEIQALGGEISVDGNGNLRVRVPEGVE